MRKHLKSILIVGVVLIMCVTVLCACNDSEDVLKDYKLIDKLQTNFTEKYSVEHITRDMESVRDDASYPKFYTELIKCTEDLDKVFTSFPEQVDFDYQTVCLYTYTSTYMGSEYFLKSVKIVNNCINIEIQKTRRSPDKDGNNFGSASVPMRRCFAVIAPNGGYEEVKFTIDE